MDYIIEHDYEAQESDELTITKGDIIKNVSNHEDGWMIGTLKGKEGVFPDNFGKPYKETKPKTHGSDDSKETKSDEDLDEPPKKQEEKSNNKVRGVGFGNIFAGEQIKLTSTLMSNVKNNKSIDGDSNPKPEKVTVVKDRNSTGELVKALYSYDPSNSDELLIQEGDIIMVLDKNPGEEGWWFGRHTSNNKTGLFPDNFVTPVKSDENKNSKLVNKTPPPVTAPKPTPSRPQPLDPKTMLKPSARNSQSNAVFDKEDGGINFDSPSAHVPLVLPTADRPKRPGKRTYNVNAGNESPEEKPIKELTASHTATVKSDPAKSPHAASVKPEPAKSSHAASVKPEPAKDAKSSVNTNSYPNSVSHNNSGLTKSHTFQHQTSSSTTTTTNSHNQQQQPTITSASTSISDETVALVDTLKRKVNLLEKQVEKLEDNNLDLVKQLSDQRNAQIDNTSLLTTKMQKLTKELDEEKSKKAVMEIELKRIKETVEEIECTLITRIGKK